MLIKIEAIVREEKFEQVKSALQDIQVNGVTISQVMGYGTQRGYTEIVRGSEVDILLHPKIKFEVVVSSEEWEQKTISAIQKAAFTGEVGDGKIFSYEIRSAVKIRTKETGRSEERRVGESANAMKSAALSKSAQKRPVIMQFSHKIIFNLPGNHSSICDFPVSLFQHDPVCTKGTH